MPRYCSINTCKYFAGCANECDITFFRTPINNEMREAWLAEIKKHQDISSRFSICQLHFENQYLVYYDINSTKAKLKLNAIPTIFPPNPHIHQSKRASQEFPSTSNSLTVKPVLRTYGRKPGTVSLVNRNQNQLLGMSIKEEPGEPDTEAVSLNRFNNDPLIETIKQEPDEQHCEVVPSNTHRNNAADINIKPEPAVPVSRQCIRCIQMDVQMQRQKLKIDTLGAKYEDQRKLIHNLKAKVNRYRDKLRLLRADFVIEDNLSSTKDPSTGDVVSFYENTLLRRKCTVCFGTYLSPGENHICDEREVITCDYCDQSFTSINDIMDHLSIHHTQKEFYKCDKCHRIFGMPLLLSFHDKQHTSAEPRLICDICDARCYTVYQMRKHMHDRHAGKVIIEQPKQFQCGTCGKCFTSEQRVKIHVKHVHDKMQTGQFECFICKRKLMSLYDTRIHLQLSHSRSERCIICNKEFTEAELDVHLCSGLKTINCTYCQQSFKSMKHLLHHLEQDCKQEKLMYRCEICKKYFKMETLRDIHRKHHTTIPKPYLCDICAKGFASKITLCAHRKIHLARGFLCDICGLQFQTSNHLKNHKLTHGERTLQCPNCDRRFATKKQLRVHRFIHQNTKFVCDICNAKLSNLKALSSHKKKHTRTDADRKYGCPICPQKFYESNSLKTHVERTHSTDRPYVCDICEQAYKYSGDLIKHKHQMHNVHSYACSSCPKRFRLKYDLVKHEFEHYTPQKMEH